MKQIKPGRPKMKASEKKVQVIYYIPRGNVKEFKKRVEPIKQHFGKNVQVIQGI